VSGRSSEEALHRIVVVGGGAAGMELVTQLGNRLGRRARASVTLVECARTHLWKPLLHAVAAGSIDPGEYEVNYLAQAHWHAFRYRFGEMIGLDRERILPGLPERISEAMHRLLDQLRRRMHQPIPEQGAWIEQVVRGYFAYHAVPTNGAALRASYYYVERIWVRTLRRRSQKDRFSWQRMHRLAADWLPQPRILHPYPDQRFAVRYPRWEPCAGIPPARILAGGGR
jgi:Pyridine nucleotide-disulphide oxidoreductase